MSREMILRKSTRQTRAQSNARETEDEGSVPETAAQAVNCDMECKMSKSKTRSRLKKPVRDKTVDVIQIDKDSDQSEDESSFLQRDQSYEKDFSMCSQENSADVLWDCTSPDMRKISRSKKKKDKLKYSVGDIVQTLSTTSDVDAEDSEDRSKNGLLGLWMDPESSDNLSRLTSTANLANFSPTSSFPPPKARKEKREVTDTLSSVLKEKLSMRIKKEKPSPPRRITRSTEKRKRGSVSLNTSDTKESPSKICKIETDVLKGCIGTDLSENFSETSWSEDDFYEDDSFIIKATQAPSDLCNKGENSSKKEKKTKAAPQEMLDFLKKLKQKCFVGIVGGSDLSKIAEQMGSDVVHEYDYVFAENGLVAYKEGKQIGQENLLHNKGEECLQKVINFALKYMSELQLPAKRGTFVEFRSSMLNLCPVGRSCSQKERDEFSAFDQENNIRKKFVEALYQNFPEAGLKFAIGGQISIDVFPVGWDKTFCLQFLEKDGIKNIHFFGDKTSAGGNDYEIYEDSRTVGHSVTSPQDTIKQVSEVIPGL
ncbi:uncharacterized protein LOC111120200 isoform X2 [Crassostrea virginica]